MTFKRSLAGKVSSRSTLELFYDFLISLEVRAMFLLYTYFSFSQFITTPLHPFLYILFIP